MSSTKLRLKSQKGTLGYDVYLRSKGGTHDVLVAENLGYDPLKKHSTKVKEGYMFRSPGIATEDWSGTLRSLGNTDGNFSITAEIAKDERRGGDRVTAWIKFAEREDAAMFAWTNVEVWQKWSDEQEKEAQEEAKQSKKRNIKATVDKDGNIQIKGKVTVKRLGL